MNAFSYDLCFETLANDLRVKILKVLREKPVSVQELAKRLNAEQSRVSHSLKMLRTCNYVEVKRQGKQHIYFIKSQLIEGMPLPKNKESASIFEFIQNHIEKYCNFECKKIH
jgi:DNA-binding transcriptional ArsR family regulator